MKILVTGASSLPGYKCIVEALEEGRIKDDLRTYTVKWYKHLLEVYDLMKQVVLKDTVL